MARINVSSERLCARFWTPLPVRAEVVRLCYEPGAEQTSIRISLR